MTHKTSMIFGIIAALFLIANAPNSAIAADGQKIMKKCKACHTWDQGGKNKLGPNLFGVYGRAAGSVDGFKYSKGFVAAKDAIGVWGEEQLQGYLKDPTKYLKANGGGKSKMTFKLKKEKDRTAVIEYLKTLK